MILSRVAETIYWIARYIERTENTARIVMVNANLLMDLPKGIAQGWEPILAITGSKELFYEHYSDLNERNVVKFLIADKYNPGSMLSSLDQARESLRTTRVIVPRGMWEVFNDLYYYSHENKAKGISKQGRYDYLTHVIRSCQLVTGNISGSMSHDLTYEFIRMGRNLERADMISRVLGVRAGNLLPDVDEGLKPFDDIQWKSILESLAAYQMYRRHVHVRVKGEAVLTYLLQDKQFPRSIMHCITEVENSLRQMPGNDASLRTLGRLQRLVNDANVRDIRMQGLITYIDELQILLGQVHEQLMSNYFQVQHIKEDDDEPVETAEIIKISKDAIAIR